MLILKLAAPLAVAASLALVPAAVANPTGPGVVNSPETAPASDTNPYSLPELVQRCRMLREAALIARDLGAAESYLEAKREYDRLHCERYTGSFPSWL